LDRLLFFIFNDWINTINSQLDLSLCDIFLLHRQKISRSWTLDSQNTTNVKQSLNKNKFLGSRFIYDAERLKIKQL